MSKRKRSRRFLTLCILALAAFGAFVLYMKIKPEAYDTASNVVDKVKRIGEVVRGD